jgi:hypothetical protein
VCARRVDPPVEGVAEDDGGGLGGGFRQLAWSAPAFEGLPDRGGDRGLLGPLALAEFRARGDHGAEAMAAEIRRQRPAVVVNTIGGYAGSAVTIARACLPAATTSTWPPTSSRSRGCSTCTKKRSPGAAPS